MNYKHDMNVTKRSGKTEEFTEEKRIFYKDIIKKLYIKWKPLIEESITEANQELNK